MSHRSRLRTHLKIGREMLIGRHFPPFFPIDSGAGLFLSSLIDKGFCHVYSDKQSAMQRSQPSS